MDWKTLNLTTYNVFLMNIQKLSHPLFLSEKLFLYKYLKDDTIILVFIPEQKLMVHLYRNNAKSAIKHPSLMKSVE